MADAGATAEVATVVVRREKPPVRPKPSSIRRSGQPRHVVDGPPAGAARTLEPPPSQPETNIEADTAAAAAAAPTPDVPPSVTDGTATSFSSPGAEQKQPPPTTAALTSSASPAAVPSPLPSSSSSSSSPVLGRKPRVLPKPKSSPPTARALNPAGVSGSPLVGRRPLPQTPSAAQAPSAGDTTGTSPAASAGKPKLLPVTVSGLSSPATATADAAGNRVQSTPLPSRNAMVSDSHRASLPVKLPKAKPQSGGKKRTSKRGDKRSSRDSRKSRSSTGSAASANRGPAPVPPPTDGGDSEEDPWDSDAASGGDEGPGEGNGVTRRQRRASAASTYPGGINRLSVMSESEIASLVEDEDFVVLTHADLQTIPPPSEAEIVASSGRKSFSASIKRKKAASILQKWAGLDLDDTPSVAGSHSEQVSAMVDALREHGRIGGHEFATKLYRANRTCAGCDLKLQAEWGETYEAQHCRKCRIVVHPQCMAAAPLCGMERETATESVDVVRGQGPAAQGVGHDAAPDVAATPPSVGISSTPPSIPEDATVSSKPSAVPTLLRPPDNLPFGRGRRHSRPLSMISGLNVSQLPSSLVVQERLRSRGLGIDEIYERTQSHDASRPSSVYSNELSELDDDDDWSDEWSDEEEGVQTERPPASILAVYRSVVLGTLLDTDAQEYKQNTLPDQLPVQLWQQLPEVQAMGALASLSKAAVKRQEALFEIAKSEEAFLADLKTLLKVFLVPLHVRALTSGDSGLSCEILQSASESANKIYKVSTAFWAALRARQQENVIVTTFNDILAKHVEELPIFLEYANVAVAVLAAINRNSKELDALRRNAPADQLSRNLPMDAFVITPVQRLARYPLLVKAVIQASGEEHEDLEALKEVHAKLSTFVQTCNETMRVAEDRVALMEIERCLRFEHTEKEVKLLSEGRKLIKRGTTELVSIWESVTVRQRKVELMLFNDLLLVTRPERAKGSDELVYLVWKQIHRSFVEVAAVEEITDQPLLELLLFKSGEQEPTCFYLRTKNTTELHRWLEAFNTGDDAAEGRHLWDCPQALALFDYEPQQPDELGLKKGAGVIITTRGNDGWSKGVLAKPSEEASATGCTAGWFPTAYVKVVASEHTEAKILKANYKLKRGGSQHRGSECSVM